MSSGNQRLHSNSVVNISVIFYKVGFNVITHCAFLVKLVFISGMEYVPGPRVIKTKHRKMNSQFQIV